MQRLNKSYNNNKHKHRNNRKQLKSVLKTTEHSLALFTVINHRNKF